MFGLVPQLAEIGGSGVVRVLLRERFTRLRWLASGLSKSLDNLELPSIVHQLEHPFLSVPAMPAMSEALSCPGPCERYAVSSMSGNS